MCFPLHNVLVAITVVVLINVSVIRGEAKARPNQARCSGLQSSFLGGDTAVCSTNLVPFSPQQHRFPHQNHIKLQRVMERLPCIYYTGLTDYKSQIQRVLMKLR